MSTIPKYKTLSASGPEIFNIIRANASTNYQNYVPKATAVPDNLREIGGIIMSYPNLKTEFVNMVGLISRILVTSKSYKNPWAFFKKGLLEMGETAEEVFVDIANIHIFDPETAEKEVFKTENPNIASAFHTLNYQSFYKQTIRDKQLRQVFYSWSGVSDLIAKIVDAMYSAMNYDELNVMKYMICKNILNGRITPVQIDAATPANMKAIAASFKGISNAWEFMSTDYNVAGVHTYSNKDSQYLIMPSAFDASFDVEVLAGAFNMTEANFLGHRVLIDELGNIDILRLNEIAQNDPNYEEISASDLQSINNSVKAVLVDRDWFMIFDNLLEFTEIFNAQGLYWNYILHAWKTMSISPFSNACLFTTVAPGVTSVSLSPATVTAAAGSKVSLTPTVVTTGFASQEVNYTSDTEGATVDADGVVTIASTLVKDTVITITATSVVDTSKTGTSKITIS